MKHLLITTLTVFLAISAFAQNTFPPTGKVGIGTTSPKDALEILKNNGGLDLNFNDRTSYSSIEGFELDISQWAFQFIGSDYVTPLRKSAIEIVNRTSTGAIDFYTQNQFGAPKVRIDPSGNVGIGTYAPYSKLEVTPSAVSWGEGIIVNPASNNYGAIFFRQTSGTLTGSWFIGKHSSDNLVILRNGLTGMSGTVNSNAALQINHGNGNALFGGNVGIGTINPTAKLEVSGNVVFGRHGVAGNISLRRGGDGNIAGSVGFLESGMESHNLAISSNSGGGFITMRTDLRERLRITYHGNVGIGTANPDEKLTVKGKIHTEEVRVDLSVPGPDYVFEEDYPLSSLEEIEAFVKSNKHLPEVPSATEMEANGVQLGEMNMLLLKKIEELTLHLIAEHKSNSELKMENDELKQSLHDVLKRIEKLEK